MIPVLLALAIPASAEALPQGAVARLGNPNLRHACPVTSLAFTADGERLAPGSRTTNDSIDQSGHEGTVKIWDAATGAQLQSWPHESAAVALSSDGRRVASAGGGGAKVWDAASGRLVCEVPAQLEFGGVALSPDGAILATTARLEKSMSDWGFNPLLDVPTVWLWDGTTGRSLRRLMPPDDGPQFTAYGCAGVAFHPDGKSVAAAVPGRGLLIWDAATGKHLRTIPGAYTLPLQSAHDSAERPIGPFVCPVPFDAKGTLVAVPQAYGLALFDPTTGEKRATIRGSESRAELLPPFALTPDGGKLLAISQNSFTLLDARTGEVIREIGEGYWPFFCPAALSPDGRLVAHTSDFGVILGDAATGERRPIEGSHDGPVGAVGFGPDGVPHTVGSVNLDYQRSLGRTGFAWPGGKPTPLKLDYDLIAFAPDFRTAFIGSNHLSTNVPYFIDTRNGVEKARLALGEGGGVTLATFSADGRRLFTKGYWHIKADKLPKGESKSVDELVLWDAATGKRLQELAADAGRIATIALSADGTRAAAADTPPGRYFKQAATAIPIWDTATCAELSRVPGQATSLAFSPDGTRLAIARGTPGGPALRVAETATGKILWQNADAKLAPQAVAFSPDGKLLATAGTDRVVRLWDAATGKPRGTLVGHAGRVTCLAFRADDKRLITGGDEGVAYVWDVAGK